MPKTPTKLQVNTLTDAMVRGGELTNTNGKWRVGRKVFSQAIVDAAKERINLIEGEDGSWTFKPA